MTIAMPLIKELAALACLAAPITASYAFCICKDLIAMTGFSIVGTGEVSSYWLHFFPAELARVVMERTSASREDVEAIGKLIREYGYATYGIPVCEEDLRAGDGTCRDRTRGTGSMVRRGNGQFLVGLDPDVPPTEQQQPLRRRAL
ncbi:predicted protein [Histoplasma capsulatum H143]|uniref:Uncharacterized protein n=1 Tax=Ajellomyces capsulatus (strain H143) TaxID=544712 RepID=C6H8S5_AJECH|nr:predicted protein [Histoplasma capsulatum H143]